MCETAKAWRGEEFLAKGRLYRGFLAEGRSVLCGGKGPTWKACGADGVSVQEEEVGDGGERGGVDTMSCRPYCDLVFVLRLTRGLNV